MARILGILNVTRDSFSDGGRHLDPESAVARGLALVEEGADVVDVGAESTRPEAEQVPAEEEIRRLEPVVSALVAAGVKVSVDTWKPAVMRRAAELGAAFVNDVRGLREDGAVEAVRDTGVRVILMHSTSAEARASRAAAPAGDVVEHVARFFEERLAELEAAGIDRARVVLDPGMGLFLAEDPGPSLRVLARLHDLRQPGTELLVSTSRKSFIGAVLGRALAGRGPGTLATEIHAAAAGADWIRTHDVRALADALRMTEAIRAAGGPRGR